MELDNGNGEDTELKGFLMKADWVAFGGHSADIAIDKIINCDENPNVITPSSQSCSYSLFMSLWCQEASEVSAKLILNNYFFINAISPANCHHRESSY